MRSMNHSRGELAMVSECATECERIITPTYGSLPKC